MKRLLLPLAVLAACSTPETRQSAEVPKSVPEWAYSANWYQIFPERFANGDPSNDPTRERINGPEGWELTPWTSDWYARADWEKKMSDDFYDGAVFARRYGGDLQGVIDRLDYLADLGVNAIYFNPVFDAVTLHKYDGSTYHHIDQNFGPDPEGDAAIMAAEDPSDPSTWQWTSADLLFLDLIKQAKARGIRVVIDGVWNHTGPEFWAFQDIVKNQQESRFKDWFDITSWDDPSTPENEFDYNGWWGFKGLPEFREENDGLIDPVRDYIFAATSRWMDPNGDGDPSDGIDGWRLDVAEEVGKRFWREWHAHVRGINPEAVTIAEIWTDKALEYVNEEMFSVVMNYRWAYPTVDFFVNESISPSEFMRRQVDVLESWPAGVPLAMQNLLDSHDTDRIFSMIVNPGREYDRLASPRDTGNPDYNVEYPGEKARETLMAMALFQYTWPGAPMIYYGTEAGMWGADDPDDRKPMVWPEMTFDDETHHPFGKPRKADKVFYDHELHQWYRSLMQTRTSAKALTHGEVNVVLADDQSGLVAYERYADGVSYLVLINRTENSSDFALEVASLKGQTYESVLSLKNAGAVSTEGTLTGTLPPRSALLLKGH